MSKQNEASQPDEKIQDAPPDKMQDAVPETIQPPPADGGAMVDPRDMTDVQPVLPKALQQPLIRESDDADLSADESDQ